MPEEKHIFTSNSFKDKVIGKVKSLFREVSETLNVRVGPKISENIKPSIFQPMKNTIKIQKEKLEKKKKVPAAESVAVEKVKEAPEPKIDTRYLTTSKEDKSGLATETKEKLMLIGLGLLIVAVIAFAIFQSKNQLRLAPRMNSSNLNSGQSK